MELGISNWELASRYKKLYTCGQHEITARLFPFRVCIAAGYWETDLSGNPIIAAVAAVISVKSPIQIPNA